ncbi:hypothetical protein Tco_0603689 [Tanacetum coccineum]
MIPCNAKRYETVSYRTDTALITRLDIRSQTINAKEMNNSQVVHEDVSFNSVGGSGNNKGGSVFGVLDEMIRVGRAMGYSMEGCEKDIESIINSKGDEAVFR